MNNIQGAAIAPPGNQPGAVVLNPPPALIHHATYQSFYNDDTQDPLQGQYDALMAVIGAPGGAHLPPHATVTEAIMGASVMDPQAFIMLVDSPAHPHGLVRLYHRVQRYVPSIAPATPHDNHGYAFKGDVLLGQSPQTVDWPDTAFHRGGQGGTIRVGSLAWIDQALAANPAATVVGPVAAHTPGCRSVRTRTAMLVPFRYIRFFVGQPLTPKEAYVQVAGAIVNDHNEVACRPLLDWLCAAVTCTVAQQASPLLELQPPPPTYMTAALLQRRWALVTKDLPALIAPGGQVQVPVQAPNNDALAASFQALVDETSRHNQADEARRALKEAKPPSAYFGETGVSKLLCLCQVATEDQLPTLWKKLAATKQSDTHLIQEQFNKTARDLGYYTTIVPLPPSAIIKIRGVGFVMSNDQDLTTGIHPLTFASPDTSGSHGHHGPGGDLRGNASWHQCTSPDRTHRHHCTSSHGLASVAIARHAVPD